MTVNRVPRRAWEALTRGVAVVVCVVVAVAGGSFTTAQPGLLTLLGIAVIATATDRPVWLRYAVILAESIGAALVVGLAAGPPEAYLAYLLAPAIVAWLNLRALGAVISVGLSTLTLVIVAALRLTDQVPRAIVYVTVWLAAVAAAALAGIAVRHVRMRTAPMRTDYAEANRLLIALRDVARQLPSGLDTVSLGESAIETLTESIGPLTAVVYLFTESDALVPVASSPHLLDAWPVHVDRVLFERAWETGTAVERSGSFGSGGSGAVAAIPMTLGGRRVGVIAIERDGDLWTPSELATGQRTADDTALRMDTARLFGEVRALATAEERRRLSREIHDGVAQEVAALGFLVDAARSSAADATTQSDLDRIREELTRITTELRLSIFDLRSDIGVGMRLGEALSDYARGVGSSAGLAVHLVLEETPTRLPRTTEAELLRIAQEAVTNTRKHAHARTLWVTLRVDAPNAYLRIADDGRGMSTPEGADHFGLGVMRERAARVGGQLSIRPRQGGGTIVEVTVGVAPGDSGTAS